MSENDRRIFETRKVGNGKEDVGCHVWSEKVGLSRKESSFGKPHPSKRFVSFRSIEDLKVLWRPLSWEPNPTRFYLK